MDTQKGSVMFYCTAGGGMETFVTDELKRKLRATEVEQIPGRVFFRCSSSLQDVMRLKSAERLFLLLRRAPPTSLPKNPAKATSVLQQSIVGDPEAWSHALSTWAALQVELDEARGRGVKRKRGEEEENNEKRVKGSADAQVAGGEDENASVLGRDPPRFRVNCRCSGAIARCYNSQTLSRIIGTAINQQLGWKADLRDPTLEVNVYISDDHSVVGIPLLRHPLASRAYLKHTGLRSTVAWAMASVCPMEEASVILDPMCGVGTILLEAAHEYPNAVFIGMDSEEAQLQKAAENVRAANLEGRILLVQSSCMGIPLPPGSVDAVLCDVPFGRKFSCSTDMSSALPRILTQMERVLREEGCLVLLLSLQLSVQIKKLIGSNTLHSHTSGSEESHPEAENPRLGSLVLQRTHKVSLGSTDALIHTYVKRSVATNTH